MPARVQGSALRDSWKPEASSNSQVRETRHCLRLFRLDEGTGYIGSPGRKTPLLSSHFYVLASRQFSRRNLDSSSVSSVVRPVKAGASVDLSLLDPPAHGAHGQVEIVGHLGERAVSLQAAPRFRA
jgi:hypothetical protein